MKANYDALKLSLENFVHALIDTVKPIIDQVISIIRETLKELKLPIDQDSRLMLEKYIVYELIRSISDADPNNRSPTDPSPEEASELMIKLDRFRINKIGGGQPPEPELRQHDPPPPA